MINAYSSSSILPGWPGRTLDLADPISLLISVTRLQFIWLFNHYLSDYHLPSQRPQLFLLLFSFILLYIFQQFNTGPGSSNIAELVNITYVKAQRKLHIREKLEWVVGTSRRGNDGESQARDWWEAGQIATRSEEMESPSSGLDRIKTASLWHPCKGYTGNVAQRQRKDFSSSVIWEVEWTDWEIETNSSDKKDWRKSHLKISENEEDSTRLWPFVFQMRLNHLLISASWTLSFLSPENWKYWKQTDPYLVYPWLQGSL